MITDILACGQTAILDAPAQRACPAPSGSVPRGIDIPKTPFFPDMPAGHDPVGDHLGIPINQDYEFEICAPPPPTTSADAVLVAWMSPGPGNTVNRSRPVLTALPSDFHTHRDVGGDHPQPQTFTTQFNDMSDHLLLLGYLD